MSFVLRDALVLAADRLQEEPGVQTPEPPGRAEPAKHRPGCGMSAPEAWRLLLPMRRPLYLQLRIETFAGLLDFSDDLESPLCEDPCGRVTTWTPSGTFSSSIVHSSTSGNNRGQWASALIDHATAVSVT